ncbi:MAG TPA: AraC family transcriptional regulator [Ramlibacter sp.]|nr:AraC family transcriptional regulator [Ramlibacter sp.]
MGRSSSSTWVKGVAEMFASQGVDVPRLFRAAGADMALLDAPDARFPADQVTRLWELAVTWSGNPALGLDRELALRHVNFDVVGYAMLSSPDLHAGLDSLSRYLALISDAATFGLQPVAEGAWLVLGHTGNTLRVPRQRQEYGLLALLMLCRWLTRREVRPLAAEFVFPDPVDLRPYRCAFECPLRFGQPATRLLLPACDLAAAIPSRNPSMYALHEKVLQGRLQALGNARTSYRVSEAIIRRLHQGEPRREDIASSLALADRTLQRRLHEEQTSFQELLDGARRELACKYLADGQYSLGEVADLLGFVDQSNFFRACKRWFGLTPTQYRQRLAGDRVPS